MLELVEVKDIGSPPANENWRNPFSLLFVLRDGKLSADGLCRLEHPDFESCDLLLSRVTVPGVHPGSKQEYYEAVFG